MQRLMAGTLLLLFFVCPPFSSGQVLTALPEAENTKTESIEPLSIKLSVEEVRLDVVVLDKMEILSRI